MKALLALIALLMCGTAAAQDSGALCRSFCDADAAKCRQSADHDAWVQHAEPPRDLAPPDPWNAAGRNEKVARAIDKDTAAHSLQCSDTRQACRQKCAAPVAAPAASATH